ncbi:MAG: hypothetical protein PVJ86_00370 [Phycisphaerales bacterium]|jgi:hypothetical protein
MKKKFLFIAIALLAIAAIAAMPVFLRERISISAGEDVWVHGGADVLMSSGALSGGNFDTASQTIGLYGDSGLVKLAAPTAIGTATPALLIDSSGVSNILEIRDAATPIFTINDGGAVVQVGASTHSGGQTINNWLKVAAPTAIATATPAAVVDSLGVSNILEVRDAATPVIFVDAAGDLDVDTVTNLDIVDIDAHVHVAVPTAQATATPGFVIDNAGVANAFEIRDATTPVAYVDASGNTTLTGYVSQSIDTENIMLPSVVSTAITYTAAAGGNGTVATIADGEIWFVHAVFVRTTTNFDADGDDATLTIGDGNDADGFIVAADAQLQATFTEATGFAAGWYGIENGSAGAYTTDDGGPFVYAPSGGAETIDWVVDETSGETLSAGEATIYVVYTRIL